MSIREQIENLDPDVLQALYEKVCRGCDGSVHFDDSECRYVCPAFKKAVRESTE